MPSGEWNISTTISIHAPLAGSDQPRTLGQSRDEISIHAPLAGSDRRVGSWCQSPYDFNPRSPCGERLSRNLPRMSVSRFQSTLPLRGATRPKSLTRLRSKFQSTLPLRGATRRCWWRCIRADNFNPRSPCGERLPCVFNVIAGVGISIHAPLAGSDNESRTTIRLPLLFQSTLPLRGATPSQNILLKTGI